MLTLKGFGLLRHFTTRSKNIVSIQDQFKQQAAWFEDDWLSRSNVSTDELMSWVHTCISETGPIESDDIGLDVATGTGIFARSLVTSGCNKVYGLDATPEMLAEAKLKCEEDNNITSDQIELVQGDAANLPFPNDSFDIVTSRLAVHHFSDPTSILEEMSRVCKPSGRVIVVDIVAPDNDLEAEEMNRLETLRDPSHVWSFQINKLKALIESTTLLKCVSINQRSTTMQPPEETCFNNPMNLKGWMEATATPPHSVLKIERAIEIEIFENGSKTGMQPHYSNGELCFTHRYVTIQAEKLLE